MTPKGISPVRHRRVFYVPGFAPIPPRQYRELYRAQARKQAVICDYSLALEAGATPSDWVTCFEDDTGRTDTIFSVLDWSDLVRDAVDVSRWTAICTGLKIALIYLRSGTFRAMLKLRRGPVLVSCFPYLFLLFWAAFWTMLMASIAIQLGPVWAVMAIVAMIWGEPKLFRWVDDRLFVTYLLTDYGFWAHRRGAYSSALEERLSVWKTTLQAEIAAGDDEILIVGHSSGAHLAISLLAEVIRDRPPDAPFPELLTLGQSVPMVSLLPDAAQLRSDLATLAAVPDLTWVDVTAPGDPCCFALCDPVAVSGCGPADVPLILSAAFSKTLTADNHAQLRRRFFRRHQQYLCAFDDPGPFDYFRITAGRQSLATLFSTRRPSPQRLNTPPRSTTDPS